MNAVIGIRDGDSVLFTTLHNDGGIDDAGLILWRWYSDEDQVRGLLSLGNLSVLRPLSCPRPYRAGLEPHCFDTPQAGVCVAYGRDRGERRQGAQAAPLSLLRQLFPDEHTYIYTPSLGWVVFLPGEGQSLPLGDALRSAATWADGIEINGSDGGVLAAELRAAADHGPGVGAVIWLGDGRVLRPGHMLGGPQLSYIKGKVAEGDNGCVLFAHPRLIHAIELDREDTGVRSVLLEHAGVPYADLCLGG